MQGAAGPSGADAELWKRILCSKQFKSKPAKLCVAVGNFAKKLNIKQIPAPYLRAFVACRSIPLDKQPGVRPIGIGEVLRRIVSGATMTLLKPEIIQSTAPMQTCAGIRGGIEATIHSVRRMYEDPEVECILLIDASNAFNALNRATALKNIKYTCPEMSTFVENIYNCEAELFVSNSEETILSKEGTTKGGPEAMPFYSCSTMPLLTKKSESKKVGYADDGVLAGKVISTYNDWLDLKKLGPAYGFFPEPTKTWCIVKPEFEDNARSLFTDVNITVTGHKYLGSFIGNPKETSEFVTKQIEEWKEDIEALVEVAKTEPQLAYSAYVFGTSKRWQFVCRTTPGIAQALQPLEDLIREKLIPAFFDGKVLSDDFREVFSMPARLGGLGILNPVDEADFEYENSQIMTSQLSKTIFEQKEQFINDPAVESTAKKEVSARKADRLRTKKEILKEKFSDDFLKLVDLSAEKGASSWLTTFTLKEFGFRINKQQFHDNLCMRYDLSLSNVPRNCVCGTVYSVNHSLTYKRGGFPIMRHNAVRDTTAKLLTEVCKDIKVEPCLLPVTGEDLPTGSNVADGARSDVSALSFWSPLCRVFFYIKVFNPLAQTNWMKEISTMHTFHEKLKKVEYNERILQIVKGSFTPLVFICFGGAAPEAEKFIKNLARMISEKRDTPYSQVVSFIRRRIRFDILRSCTVALRGERGNGKQFESEISDLDVHLVKLGHE